MAAAAEAAACPARASRKVRPAWVPAGIVSRTLPLSVRTGTSAPRSASSSVSGSSRSRSAPAPGEDRVGLHPDDDEQVAAAGRLAGQPDRVPVSAPAGILTSRRLPSTSTSRVVPR